MGRMGQQLIKSSKSNNNFRLVALTENRIINKKFNGIKPEANTHKAFEKTDVIVDFTVHLLSKYDLARKELGKSPEEAIYFSFEAVGFALIIMTAVLSMGFAVLHLVNFIPLHDFAQFSIIAFIVALLIDFFLFPNLLVKFDKRKFN